MTTPIADSIWVKHAQYAGGFALCCATIPTFATGALAATAAIAVALPVNMAFSLTCYEGGHGRPVDRKAQLFSNNFRMPIEEEIIYRGILQTAFSALTPSSHALTSITFGCKHVEARCSTKSDYFTLFYTTALSYFVLCPIFTQYGLIASIAAHALHNIAGNIMDELYIEGHHLFVARPYLA